VSPQIPNPFTMNDWNIVDFLKAISILQFVLLSVIAVDSTVLKIPVLRALFALIYLTFVPGIILLRVFQLHRLGSVETVLYAVGLSLATVMFTGLILNVIGPVIGIANPLSLIPLIFSLSIVVLIFGALSYVRDKGFSDTAMIAAKDVPPSAVFFVLVPLLSIYGTFAMNAYQNNILLILLLLVIGSAIIISVYQKKDLTNIYPLIVFSVSLALLLSQSLISPYLSGFDIQVEHYFGALVVQQSYWNAALVNYYNAMLSIVMLAPIFSVISNLDLIWVLKIFYPSIYSLVPVGLYWLYKKQMDSSVAFLSVMFFVSLSSFYIGMPTLAKQEIAELFLVLILLLVVDSRIQKTKRSILLITFSLGLIVSHYATTYIFMVCLVAVLIILSAAKLINKRQKRSPFSELRIAAKIPKLNLPRASTDTAFTVALIILFAIAALAWFMYAAGGSSLTTFTNALSLVGVSISSELFSTQSAQGIAVLAGASQSLLHAVNKYLYLITEFFIVIGFAATMLRYNNASLRLHLNRELLALNVPVFCLLVAGVAVPYVAQSIQTTRLLHICLIFLAPLFVIGVVALSEAVGKIVTSRLITYQGVLGYISIFLAIFLLFDSGFIYQVTNDHPNAIALNNKLDGVVFNNMEVAGAKWLVQHNKTYDTKIYADQFRWPLVRSLRYAGVYMFSSNLTAFVALSEAHPSYFYMYLGTINVQQNELNGLTGSGAVKERGYADATQVTSNHSLIYSNGGSEIYVW